MICAGRNVAVGFRAERWAEGRERSEDGADGRCLPTHRGVCALGARPPTLGTVSHGAAASGRRYGNLGFCWDGERETGGTMRGLELGKGNDPSPV
jgi:hypothetical protein